MSKVVVSTNQLRGKHIPTLQRIMEISKSLQEEILTVQNKLKNAIRDHQTCVDKLKDDPDNTNILDQIQQIQIYIVSLGRRQKQVVQRLRTEVETLKAENANGSKVSVSSLLGLHNNNHINNNNEAKVETNDTKNFKDINGVIGIIKKEDYEDEIRNTDNSSPSEENDSPNRERSNSVESIPYEEEIVEISGDENSSEKQDMEEEFSAESSMQVSFLGTLGLITTTKSKELQNRKAERKRRSTANPQFVYSNWELPTKRRRHSYLQSAGKAPQTRQSTARSVGPSPPPGKILSNKSLPPSTKNSSKILSSTQKLAGKPNILRNGSENKVFNKNGTENAQSIKSLGSKVVHIPGLPSSLTIERIEADSAICISCRNPGTLTVCQQCSSKYHISCHTISHPPSKTCPKCALNSKENSSFAGVVCKKENELAAAANTTGSFGKTRENSKVNKTPGGFHKIDATTKRSFLPSNFGINQLPASTYLIPITSNSATGTDHTNINNQSNRNDQSEFRIIDQYSHSGVVTYISNSESQLSNSPNQGTNNRDNNPSYLFVKKVPETSNFSGQSSNCENRSQNNPILNYQLSSPCGYSTTHGQPEMPLSKSFNKTANKRAEPNTSGGKKPNNRSLPGLNRIVLPNNKQHGSDSSTSDEDAFNEQQNVPRFGDLFDSLFSVNNKSDILASSSNEPQGASADGADNPDNWQLSQIQHPSCNDGTEQLWCLKPPNSAEHVKLEEAHLSAPSRTKLNYNNSSKLKRLQPKQLKTPKSIVKSKQKLKNKTIGKTGKTSPKLESKTKPNTNNTEEKKNLIHTVMEVTLDDSDENESPEEINKETEKIISESKEEKMDEDIIIIKNNEDIAAKEEEIIEKEVEIIDEKEKEPIVDSLNKEDCPISEDLQNFYNIVKVTLDFIISERKHTACQMGDCAKNSRKNSCFKQLQNEAIELPEEVLITDDKADSESQDLFSDNSRPLIIDEGNVPAIERFNSNQSNTPSLEIKDTIIIESVSSEKIELLEQFESAILNINQEIDG